MNLKAILLILLVVSPWCNALAQTACPYGVPVGDARCGPSSMTSGLPMISDGTPSEYDTWGAVAIDVDSGNVGGATGNRSRHRAKRDALAECTAHGGKNCKVYLTYQGGCAAVALSDQALGAAAQDAPTSDQAKSIALQTCTDATHGTCGLVYSACTAPEQR